jgi:hypothetical protein
MQAYDLVRITQDIYGCCAVPVLSAVVFWGVTFCSHVGGYNVSEEGIASIFRAEHWQDYTASLTQKTTTERTPAFNILLVDHNTSCLIEDILFD